ncbi:MAG TPA: hypothetical protein VG649_15140 [Candidatus Angelobacter sp.]|jgi:hypothetical protein|nr:hypothetical protein [Candidatus Angelobacter sp.]
MLRKLVVLLMLCAVLASPASGFDSFWHSEATRQAANDFGFSDDARKIMQLGNFSPDFFGPVADLASSRLPTGGLEALNQYVANNGQDRDSAVFLHFDNLFDELNSNSKFDYVFNRLLSNTQATLAFYNKVPGADNRTRKALVLVTLGASLHAIQDFYSHSDWIHNDFNKTSVKLVRLSSASGEYRAPTWFEFREKAGSPEKWPFRVKTGIYPPIAGALNTHTHMNHDNSRLMYKEFETAGAPSLFQAKYHDAGPVPAHDNDPASALAHQQLAFNTAVAASSEWIKKIEESGEAKAAVEFAKGWNLKSQDKKLGKELEAGLTTELALSCVTGKWDGEDPQGERGFLCRSILDKTIGSVSGSKESKIESLIIGIASSAGFPVALKYTGKFWDVHTQYHILSRLTEGISSGSGHYNQLK